MRPMRTFLPFGLGATAAIGLMVFTACSSDATTPTTLSPIDAGPGGGPDDAAAIHEAGDAALDPCPSGWICPAKPVYSSRVGAWYTNIWRKPNSVAPPAEYFSWTETRYRPSMGFYDSDDAVAVTAHLDQMTSAGIDFMIVDGTNGYATTLAKDTDLLVHTDLARPPAMRVPIAFALGANLWGSGTTPEAQAIANHQAEVDKAIADFANNTTTSYKYFPELNASAGKETIDRAYFRWEGLPLLVVYNSFGPGGKGLTWTDPRLSVRNATGVVHPNDDSVKTYGALGWWGWTTEYPQLLTQEEVGVVAGADNVHRGCAGCTYVLDRENGALFEREWLRAIKQNPKAIVLSSWNDFVDETAIEPASPSKAGAPAYTDSYGDEVPDWYLQMTRGYSQLRVGFIDGYVYAEEGSTTSYRVVNRTWQAEPKMPHKQPVIRVPAGTLSALMNR